MFGSTLFYNNSNRSRHLGRLHFLFHKFFKRSKISHQQTSLAKISHQQHIENLSFFSNLWIYPKDNTKTELENKTNNIFSPFSLFFSEIFLFLIHLSNLFCKSPYLYLYSVQKVTLFLFLTHILTSVALPKPSFFSSDAQSHEVLFFLFA